MQSLLLLLFALCSCKAVRLDKDNRGGTGEYHKEGRASTSNLLHRERPSDEFRKDLTYIDSQKISNTRRRKRALASFSDALNAVLDSMVGFAKVDVNGKEMKLFVKVGSYADATKDFYSLGPNSVTNISPRMITGVAGRYTIGLRAQPPTLYILNGNKSGAPVQGSKGEEYIFRYFNSVREAKLALGRWGVFSSEQ